MNKSDEFIKSLTGRMEEKGFIKRSKSRVINEFDGGFWYFSFYGRKSVRYMGTVFFFQLGYHLESAEKLVSEIFGVKYSKNSVTGCFNQLGQLFHTYHELLITENTNIDDAVDDVIYHYEKYCESLVKKYFGEQEIYKGIFEDKTLEGTMHTRKFQCAAILLLNRRYDEMLAVMEDMPEGLFYELPFSKAECISKARSIIKES
ncbi:MAG: hypothetical protein K2K57_07325 [Oscillospiraceae bacterium]|nr:hypothetical protein [Oscillospiraceae bacterium]